MPNHNDLRDYVERQREERAAGRAVQLRATVELGRRAQMLTESTGWGLLVEHVTALKTVSEQARAAKVQEIVEGDALGDALAKLKLDVARLDGAIKALAEVINAMPALVKQGQEAAATLNPS